MLTIFLPWGIFSIHHTCKKIKKEPEQKIFLHPKISSVRLVSHAKEFLRYVFYFQTFGQELQMAHSIPILRVDIRDCLGNKRKNLRRKSHTPQPYDHEEENDTPLTEQNCKMTLRNVRHSIRRPIIFIIHIII